jgi:hypothetical protein
MQRRQAARYRGGPKPVSGSSLTGREGWRAADRDAGAAGWSVYRVGPATPEEEGRVAAAVDGGEA